MAVTVQQHLARRCSAMRRRDAPGGRLAQPGTPRAAGRWDASGLGLGARQHGEELVAQGQAGRTAPARRWERRARRAAVPQRADARASARASSTSPADRNVRPQHSGRPPSRASAQHGDAVAEPVEHLDGVVQVLGLEVGVERIGEQRDLARHCASRLPADPLPLWGGARGGGNPECWPCNASPGRTGRARQRGSGRLADRPVSRSASHAAPGMASRAFISGARRAA